MLPRAVRLFNLTEVRKTAIIEIKTADVKVEAKEFDTIDLKNIISTSTSENKSEYDVFQALAEAQTLLPEDLEKDDLDKLL